MTNHHDQMRVAPDPSRAEELRQRLHARLAGGPPATTTPFADTDHDRQGDLIMLETEDRPTRHEPPNPTRRSPGRWLLAAAVVAIVAVAGAALIAAGGDDETEVPAGPPTDAPRVVTDLPGMTPLEPGTYVVDPDLDESTPLAVTFELAAEGWTTWSGTYIQRGTSQTAVNIVTIDNLLADACTDHTPADPPIGPTVDDLASALAALHPFEVTVPPTDVTLLGYQGKHLQLAIPAGFSEDGCADGYLATWLSAYVGEDGFTGYNDAEPGRTEDFWILDVDGERLVIETNQGPASPAQDLAERDAIFDSIQIQP
jgi:hypothetical protein